MSEAVEESADQRRQSYEERLAELDRETGWRHPGRILQRVIAAALFLLGSVWAVILLLSLFLIIGVIPNVIFIFGWLIYGGWFFVLLGKPMSVSLRFFWMASIVVHAVYGFFFTSVINPGNEPWEGLISTLLESGLAWWIPAAASVVALAGELWAQRDFRREPGPAVTMQ
jgi:hypothetical protein